jgi:hypothetical protein
MVTLPMALAHDHRFLTGALADEGLARRIADQFFSAVGPLRQRRGERS